MSRGAFFDSVASILSHVLHRQGMETRVFEHKLRQQWPDIVSEQIAAHTRPDQIRFKKLYLIVENSVWLQQLTFLKPTLLEKINEAAGSPVVTELVLRVGEVQPGKRQTGKGSSHEEAAPVAPTAESLAEAAAHAATVTDPDLRAKLAEVMANALSQQADPRPR